MSDSKSPEGKAHLGIPKAQFIESVESRLSSPGLEAAEALLKETDGVYQKYKFMEQNLRAKQRKLSEQLPDISRTLDIVRHLEASGGGRGGAGDNALNAPLVTHFLLSDQLYVKTEISPATNHVFIWLGANIMMEYTLAEANELLVQNLNSAREQLTKLDGDIDFLKDQITTTEVNMAQLHNYCVKQRSQAETAGSATATAVSS